MKSVRHTARALIVTESHEILLLSVKLPWMEGETWTLPGGGIEENETASECARREIQEEVGLTYSGVLKPCWHATIEFVHEDKSYATHEQYFIARVPEQFEPTMANMMDYEKDFSLELRWWSIEDFVARKGHFSPKQVPEMVKDIIQNTAPGNSLRLLEPMPANYRS